MPRTRRRTDDAEAVETVGGAIQPLAGDARDYDGLLALVGDARFVLIGEASHGTKEFYAERAVLTRRLIVEMGFGAVCIEGDWPDAWRVDRYVRAESEDVTADGALGGFVRFPSWMWRNDVVRDFVAWLSDFNDDQPNRRVGFYGLDLYSLFGSIQSVLQYLDKVDPEAARRARYRYGCFEHFGEDSHAYGHATGARMADACEDEAVRQLAELRSLAAAPARQGDAGTAVDDFFSAEQNARLVKNAEQYYRSMYRGRASSWNLRDRHMSETLDAVAAHLDRTRRPSRIVVWAHNSHLGDARFTDMRRRGEINLGQLARERHGPHVRLIGFSTNTGTVTAAHEWDEPGRQMRVRPALPGSYEHLFAEIAAARAQPRFLLTLRPDDGASRALATPRLQRAIGVVYRPETERLSHYYEVDLTRQFDAMIHIDDTTAVRALEPGEHWERGVEEVPETFPSGV